ARIFDRGLFAVRCRRLLDRRLVGSFAFLEHLVQLLLSDWRVVFRISQHRPHDPRDQHKKEEDGGNPHAASDEPPAGHSAQSLFRCTLRLGIAWLVVMKRCWRASPPGWRERLNTA